MRSLYDEAIRLLARRGFDLDADCIERAWSRVNSGPEQHWDLYELGNRGQTTISSTGRH